MATAKPKKNPAAKISKIKRVVKAPVRKSAAKVPPVPVGPPPNSQFPSRAVQPPKQDTRPPIPRPRPVITRNEPATPAHIMKFTGAKAGDLKSVEAPGPLLFLGGQIVMGNTAAGVSQIGLEIDGEMVLIARADLITSRGLTMPNASGVFATHASFGNLWTLVIGWPYPLKAARGVRLSVQVLEEIGELELTLFIGR